MSLGGGGRLHCTTCICFYGYELSLPCRAYVLPEQGQEFLVSTVLSTVATCTVQTVLSRNEYCKCCSSDSESGAGNTQKPYMQTNLNFV